MAEWKQGEPGPRCTCGMETIVTCMEELPLLMCAWHERGHGRIYCLPREKPDKWPDLTDDEMRALITEGNRQHEEAGLT